MYIFSNVFKNNSSKTGRDQVRREPSHRIISIIALMSKQFVNKVNVIDDQQPLEFPILGCCSLYYMVSDSGKFVSIVGI